jgi:hypothetical protein
MQATSVFTHKFVSPRLAFQRRSDRRYFQTPIRTQAFLRRLFGGGIETVRLSP